MTLWRYSMRLAFQETHPESLFQECSHFCELVSGANQMPRALEVAIREAVGRRGVSVLVLPGDVALQPGGDAPPIKVGGLLPPAAIMRPGDNPLRLGMRRAHGELLALGERLKAPMVQAMRGKEHVE
jgi:pyruvate dehydrogenase (quinone)